MIPKSYTLLRQRKPPAQPLRRHPFQQQGELLPGQFSLPTETAGEGAALQAFVPDGKPIAIPVEDLDQGSVPVEKEEQ